MPLVSIPVERDFLSSTTKCLLIGGIPGLWGSLINICKVFLYLKYKHNNNFCNLFLNFLAVSVQTLSHDY